MDLDRRLMECLDQPGASLGDARAQAWSGRAGSDHPELVLFGAGRLGRKVRAALAGSRFPVLAFCDSDPARWGGSLDGLPVLAPADAAERFGARACFVVTIWRAEGEPHRFPDTEAGLRAMGVQRVAHFTHLAWAHPEGLVPHYSLDLPGRVLAARAEVLAALALFQEPRSRDRFVRHALWRLTLDFDLLPATDPEEIYFPEGLIRPGGCAHDLGETEVADLVRRNGQLRRDATAAIELLFNAPSVLARFEDTGVVTAETCQAIGLVGPAARACGVSRDVRRDFPYGIFRFAQLPVCTWDAGDVFGRAYVRWLEVQQSLAFVEEQLQALPGGAMRNDAASALAPGRSLTSPRLTSPGACPRRMR